MKLNKLPIYYRFLECNKISENINKLNFKGNSKYHDSTMFEPKPFYKAISKLLAFGNNKEQNI